MITLLDVTVDSLNVYARMWHVVCRLIGDIENVIKLVPGTAGVIQRYMSDKQDGIHSVTQVGARQMSIQLNEDYPAFQLNEDDPIAGELQSHKNAVLDAQKFVKLPLRSIISPASGGKVTAQQARRIAVLIDDERVVSKLRITLNLNESDFVGSTDVLTVIHRWCQSSSQACVFVLRDALHQLGLQGVGESVFGHIEDQ